MVIASFLLIYIFWMGFISLYWSTVHSCYMSPQWEWSFLQVSRYTPENEILRLLFWSPLYHHEHCLLCNEWKWSRDHSLLSKGEFSLTSATHVLGCRCSLSEKNARICHYIFAEICTYCTSERTLNGPIWSCWSVNSSWVLYSIVQLFEVLLR